jgi:hypothetical protein
MKEEDVPSSRNEMRVIFLDSKPINSKKQLNKHVHTTTERERETEREIAIIEDTIRSFVSLCSSLSRLATE